MFLHKVVNFKNFSRPNKEIKYFLRTLTEFKTFQDNYYISRPFQDSANHGVKYQIQTKAIKTY